MTGWTSAADVRLKEDIRANVERILNIMEATGAMVLRSS